MARRRSSSQKSKKLPNFTLDFDRLFRKMDEQRASAAAMITEARAMRIRALEMQDKMSRSISASIILP